jgi:hypothetical protein
MGFHTGRKWLAAAAGVVVLTTGGCGTGDGGSTDSGAKTPAAPFRATNADVRAAVTDKLGGKSDYGKQRVRDVTCSHRRVCSVAYNADTPAFDVERELIEEQRPVWKVLFSDRKLRQASLLAYGQTTSVGGKGSLSPVVRVTCDRAADRQIDWDNVDQDGIKTLCTVTPLAKF